MITIIIIIWKVLIIIKNLICKPLFIREFMSLFVTAYELSLSTRSNTNTVKSIQKKGDVGR